MIDHPWAWIAGVSTVVCLLHRIWFVLLPARFLERMARGEPRRMQAILEWINATPSLLGNGIKVAARYKLLMFYEPQRRYADVERLCRAILAHRLHAGLESAVRRHLADALDGLGKRDEAELEQERAGQCLDEAPVDVLGQLSRGKLLMEQDRHLEAIEAFEAGLALVAPEKQAVRVEFLIQLVLACFHAGRPAETVRWAEQAIAAGAAGVHLSAAHRMAGLAYSTIGNLEAAEEHLQLAYSMVTAAGASDTAAHCLVQLANLQRVRGQLAEAEATCQKVAASSPKSRRDVQFVQAEIARVRGRFEVALQTLRLAREATGFATPSAERRSQALVSLNMAWIEAEAGQAELAWGHLKEAVAELGQDAKLGLRCDATAAWVLALLSRRDQAVSVLQQAETRVQEFDQDRTSQMNLHSLLGKASAALGDFERSQTHWQRFLDLKPHPVSMPSGWYFLGECRRQLGDIEGARAAFQEACTVGIETFHSRLASLRMQE